MSASYPLRPFLPGDTIALRELFAQSIEELTADDYDEDQRVAWASTAADAEAFRDATLKEFGAVDVLINNAGIIQPFVPDRKSVV